MLKSCELPELGRGKRRGKGTCVEKSVRFEQTRENCDGGGLGTLGIAGFWEGEALPGKSGDEV